MVYELLFEYEGKKYFLAGEKHVKNDYFLDFWKDTTTLHTTLYAGEDASGQTIGEGVLRISFFGLLKMMGTFYTFNVPTLWGRMKSLMGFLSFFLSNIVDIYFPFLKIKR